MMRMRSRTSCTAASAGAAASTRAWRALMREPRTDGHPKSTSASATQSAAAPPKANPARRRERRSASVARQPSGKRSNEAPSRVRRAQPKAGGGSAAASTIRSSRPAAVAAAVAAALPPGSTCEELWGDALRQRLAAGTVDAVIYPFNETFPADTFDDVYEFVKEGGVLVDIGGAALWYPCTETAPGVFHWNKRGEDAEPMRRKLRLSLDAFWLNPALPREGRAFPTAAALAAGYQGDPAGERVRRFQKPDRLRPEDQWVPLLTMTPGNANAKAPAIAASLIRYGGDLKGCLAVCGNFGGGANPVDETVQARYLVRAMAIAFALGVEQCYWYEFRSTETDPHYSEHHFGLTHADFSPKPALRAYMDFIAHRPPGSVQRTLPLRDPETGLWRSEWTRPDGTVAGVRWKPGEIEEPVFYEGGLPPVR